MIHSVRVFVFVFAAHNIYFIATQHTPKKIREKRRITRRRRGTFETTIQFDFRVRYSTVPKQTKKKKEKGPPYLWNQSIFAPVLSRLVSHLSLSLSSPLNLLSPTDLYLHTPRKKDKRNSHLIPKNSSNQKTKNKTKIKNGCIIASR